MVSVKQKLGILFVLFLGPCIATDEELSFSSLFPLNYDFSNKRGGKLPCQAQGHPPPNTTWLLIDGSPVSSISKLRHTMLDGSLVFPPFSAEEFRQDIHGVSYMCAASNTIGSIVSPHIKVKGVVNQVFDIQVYDVYAMRGNTAIMRCHIPKFLERYVNVTTWIKDSVISIKPSTLNSNSKYMVMPSGELLIKDVDSNDAHTTYRCQVYHRLTGETKTSEQSGRLIVTDSEGRVPPKIIYSKTDLAVMKDDNVFVPCIANGNPPANYKWAKQDTQGNFNNIQNDYRIKFTTGSMYIEGVQSSDGGMYTCTASNEIKSDKVFTRISIIEPLKVKVTPSKAVVDADRDVTFKCKVEGMPIDSITWMKDGKAMPKNDIFQSNNDTVYISKMSSQLMGIYQCFAENEFHSAYAIGIVKLGDTLPILTKTFDEKILSPQDDLELQCSAKGNPVPQLNWILDNSELPARGRVHVNMRSVSDDEVESTMRIKHVNVEDGGVYHCTASNKKGKSTHIAQIFVKGKLGVRHHVKYHATEASVVQIDCPVYGYPIKNIQWKKDGRILPLHKRHDNPINGSLIISNVQRRSDSGKYICTATGDHDETVSSSVELLIMVAPKITPFSFQDELIREGARARIQCVVREGDSPIDIAWFKDGLPLTQEQSSNIHNLDEFSSILMINSITPRHNGNYTCKATNSAGTAHHTASLYINVAPKITPFFFPENVFEGRSFIRVSCVVYQGDLPITFQWFKNDISLNNNKATRIIDDYSSILTLENIQKQHAGNYTCVASNAASTVSHSSQLIVHVPPKVVPFSFQDEFLPEGTLVRISCIVSRGDLPLTISWLKDNNQVSSDLLVSIRAFDDYSSILSIDPLKYEHSGNYTCIAKNHAGTASHSAKLTVQVPLRWIAEPTDIIAKSGDKVSVACQAEGYPTPQISWEKSTDSKRLIGETKVIENKGLKIFSNGSLVFQNIQRVDEGLYICIASNGIQEPLSHVVSIKVQAAPEFEVVRQDMRTHRGSSIEIPCEASGNWPISYSWTINNNNIDNANTRYKIEENQDKTNRRSVSTLHITWADRKDSTSFTCKAKNDIGESSVEFNLIVEEKPDAPIIQKPIRVINQTVIITWTLDFNGNSDIKRYLIQYKKDGASWDANNNFISVKGNSESTANITQFQPNTLYCFRILAENEIGNSSYSEEIKAKTEEIVPTGAPENVDVESIDANTLRVTWKPPQKHLWNGIIRGYNVGFRIHGSSDQFTFTSLEVPEDYTEELIYQLSDLHMYTQYDIIVEAYNSKGKGPTSDMVLAMTSEDVPSTPPEGVRCSSLSSKSIYILWEKPEAETINGILRGYKILYKPVDEWSDALMQSKIIESSKVTLSNLEVNTNYSIQVLAFTKMGDGIKSLPIYCKTHEDVPEPPESIKVLPSSADSVVVAWKPPYRANGALTKYKVYYKPLADDHKIDLEAQNTEELQRDASVHQSAINKQFIELKGLKKNKKYAFWVTATSAIGESAGSSVVAQTVADSLVAAKTASFDSIIKKPWNEDIVLPCLAVGSPAPNRKWTFGNQALKENSRIKLGSDGSVIINKISTEDSGNYTCTVYNEHGRDQVSYVIVVQVPPSAPVMDIVSKTRTSIKLQWKAGIAGGESIRGYILHYKEGNGIWNTKDLRPDQVLYTLDNLSCGTIYQLYMEAFNNIGTGAPCDIVTVSTEGADIITPNKDQIIREGSTFVTIHLEVWPSSGCPVKSFTAEYKSLPGREWTVAGSNIKPTQKKLVISGLKPATWYLLRLTVDAGSKPIMVDYRFATHTTTGGTLAPDTFEETLAPVYVFYMDPVIFYPAVILLLVVFITSLVICFYLRRRKCNVETPSDACGPVMQMNTWARPHTLPRHHFGHHSAQSTLSRRSADPSPYATSHLTDIYHPEHGKTMRAIPSIHQESFQRGDQPWSSHDFVLPTATNCHDVINADPKQEENDGYDPPPKDSAKDHEKSNG